jgi:anti-sigma-K factor RskA
MSEPFDAIDVALGEVAPEQRAAADERLRSDAAFRAEVERLRGTVARLEAQPEETWSPPPPPPLLSANKTRRRPALPRVLVPALASVALIAVGVFGTLAVQDLGDDEAPGRSVALEALPLAPRASGQAEVGDGVRLTVSDLRPSRPGEYYELWLLNSPEDLVSVGAFRVGEDGRATVEFPLGVDPSRYKLLDVSVERDDGDPGHSARSVLRSS